MSLTKDIIDHETVMIQGGERSLIHLHREDSICQVRVKIVCQKEIMQNHINE